MKLLFFNPVRVLSGSADFSALGPFLEAQRVLLVTTKGMERRGLAKQLTGAWPHLEWHIAHAAPNPELAFLEEAARSLKKQALQKIIALGGGSAMDSAKAFAFALASAEERPLTSFFAGQAKIEQALPYLCLPTTAGTGAEVTPFATIWESRAGKKLSLADPLLFAEAAILIPELTRSLPWNETLYGALDALSHSLETLWNKNASPITLSLARTAISLIEKNLRQIKDAPEDLPGREALQQAALLAGLAISQNKTAILHAISYPLTLKYGIPHGLACSFALSGIGELVNQAEAWRSPEDFKLARQATVLAREFNLPELMRSYCSIEDILALAPEMYAPERADNFILPLSREQLLKVLTSSMQQAGAS